MRMAIITIWAFGSFLRAHLSIIINIFLHESFSLLLQTVTKRLCAMTLHWHLSVLKFNIAFFILALYYQPRRKALCITPNLPGHPIPFSVVYFQWILRVLSPSWDFVADNTSYLHYFEPIPLESVRNDVEEHRKEIEVAFVDPETPVHNSNSNTLNCIIDSWTSLLFSSVWLLYVCWLPTDFQ